MRKASLAAGITLVLVGNSSGFAQYQNGNDYNYGRTYLDERSYSQQEQY